MAVKAGAPRPNIGTVDALKRTLLAAKSIAYSDSASGVYLSTELFPKLGIADQIKDKTQKIEADPVGEAVARGEIEIGFQQISELRPVKGIEIAGELPPGAQRVTVFAAGIPANSRQPEAARALIRWLASPVAYQTIRKSGLEPLSAQSYPPPFPREAARMLFENDRVAVWDVTWPKGQPSAMHEHPVDQLSVTLVGGTKRVTRPGGTPTVSDSKRGQLVFTPKGTIHMEEGLSDVPERKIMLQLKSSQSLSGDGIPREGAVKLFENVRAIAWDFAWKSGQKTTVPADPFDSVIVFLDGGTIRSGSKDSVVVQFESFFLPTCRRTCFFVV